MKNEATGPSVFVMRRIFQMSLLLARFRIVQIKKSCNKNTVRSCKSFPPQMSQQAKLLAYQLQKKKLDLLC